MTPQRIQLRRRKGYRKPEGAIVVARPHVLGNPFHVVRVGSSIEPWRVLYIPHPKVDTAAGEFFVSEWETKSEAIQDAVDEYRYWATEGPNHYLRVQYFIDHHQIAGHDLACWCPLEDADGNRVPCHADVLLELANPGWQP